MNLQNQTYSSRLCCLSYTYQQSQKINESQRSFLASSTNITGLPWEEVYNCCLFFHPLTKSINMYFEPTMSPLLSGREDTETCTIRSAKRWRREVMCAGCSCMREIQMKPGDPPCYSVPGLQDIPYFSSSLEQTALASYVIFLHLTCSTLITFSTAIASYSKSSELLIEITSQNS